VIEAIENLFIFFPTPAAKDWQPPPSDRVEDVYLPLPGAPDVRLHAWWCPPPNWDGRGPVVLYLHGNSGNLSQRGLSIACWQVELRAPVLIVDYPGYGRSTGRPSEAGCYATADAAYDWLVQTKRVPPEQIIVYGGSLGGAVAVELATRRPHRALVLVATFTSVRDLGRELYPVISWLAHDRFNSLARIGRCHRPVFIAHGMADRLISFRHGERLFAAANEPKQFLPLPGHDHHDPLGKEFYAAVRDFLARHG
jgi:fermentation-respiration switch protein FrsA (DUF1100 family)